MGGRAVQQPGQQAVQGTVRSYEPADRTAQVVLDDGSEVVLAPGGLHPAVRALRAGQRLDLAGVADGVARSATLPGLPHPAFPGPEEGP